MLVQDKASQKYAYSPCKTTAQTLSENINQQQNNRESTEPALRKNSLKNTNILPRDLAVVLTLVEACGGEADCYPLVYDSEGAVKNHLARSLSKSFISLGPSRLSSVLSALPFRSSGDCPYVLRRCRFPSQSLTGRPHPPVVGDYNSPGDHILQPASVQYISRRSEHLRHSSYAYATLAHLPTQRHRPQGNHITFSP